MADALRVANLQITNFRCFSRQEFALEGPLVLIEGNNGSGKTSLLEALYYICYLRSFRTHSPKELVRSGEQTFFIHALIQIQQALETFQHEIQVGFSHDRRMVKVDQKIVSSYKDLISLFRVVSVTEDDLMIIQGGPQERRQFLDQALMLTNHAYMQDLKNVRHILDQRNALLEYNKFNTQIYHILTEQLWHATRNVQNLRIHFLEELEQVIKHLITVYMNDRIIVSFAYRSRLKQGATLQEFLDAHPTLEFDERRIGRSLFGPHLDDISIEFQDMKTKAYASRGQQKLIILLMKIAQISLLSKGQGSTVCLLDDFMTDFDQDHAFLILQMLDSVPVQRIFTSPVFSTDLSTQLQKKGAQRIKLTH